MISVVFSVSVSAQISLVSVSNPAVSRIVTENDPGENIPIVDFIYSRPEVAVTSLFFIILIFIFLLIFTIVSKKVYCKKTEKLLFYDDLTGHYNYRKFIIEAEKLLKSSRKQNYALLYIDIAKFKYINDMFGYEEGDSVLIHLSDILKECTFKGELFSRIYADRFVILIKYDRDAELSERLSRIEKAFSFFSEKNKSNYSFIIHGGVYMLCQNEFNIEVAVDRANYAKETISNVSKNSFAFYDDEMRNLIIQDKETESVMRFALQNHQFIPYFQPKVNILTGEMIGAEALVRWQQPKKRLILPANFIPYFEKNGFIVHIDLYMYEEVCKKLNEWNAQGKKLVPVSCNFSRLHIMDPNFPDNLYKIAQKYEVATNLLELEMNETVAMEDLDKLTEVAKALRSYGFIFTIDDFGSGYSSLGLIQKLPIDVLKLDRSFVINGLCGDLEKDLVLMLVQISRKYSISVICEGIETKEQETFMKEIGCFQAQGFLYAKPMPCEEFEKRLALYETIK
jgi:diguanylate cyclase (GGDEF) domain